MIEFVWRHAYCLVIWFRIYPCLQCHFPRHFGSDGPLSGILAHCACGFWFVLGPGPGPFPFVGLRCVDTQIWLGDLHFVTSLAVAFFVVVFCFVLYATHDKMYRFGSDHI